MAWTFQINTFPATGGEALWYLKEFLVSQGWDVPRSGSGTGGAYNASGDVHSPGGGTQWLPNNSTYRMDVVAGGATEGHGFFFGTRVSDSTGGYAGVLSLDVVEEADALDADPAIIGTNFYGNTRFALSGSPFYYETNPSQTSGVSMGWYQKGLGSPNFVPYPAAFIGGGEGFGTNQVPVNADRISQQTDNSFVDFPVWYWRGGSTHTTERGKKGRSTLYRASQPRLSVFRPNSTLTQMSVGALSIPWDGSTIPIF